MMAKKQTTSKSYRRKMRSLRWRRLRTLRSLVLQFTILASLVTSPSHVVAQLPKGGQVVGGQAAISNSANSINVNASTNRSIVNWDSFSVGAGRAANFNLPSANAAILNRVTGASLPSTIAGALNSNGNVYLVNPAGIMVTSSGMVNTNGFTASTFDVTNRNFMEGGALSFRSNGSGGSIVNRGTIATGSGGAHLIANEIANHGSITSVGGNITMSGGGEVTLSNGVTYVQPSISTLESGVSPTAALIQNTGTIRATGAATSGGEIYLVTPNGSILHDGTIAAQVADEATSPLATNANGPIASSTTGGHVQLEADEITLTGNSSIDTNGTHGGGDVLVGGDWQGSGDMTQATTVTMDAGAVIDASATDSGDGGKIVLWSDITNVDSVTNAFGTLLARAGDLFGNGGEIETSGSTIDTNGIAVDAGAANGTGGHWLIDPYNYVIDAVSAAMIVTTLNTGTSVTVTTTNNNMLQGSSGNNADQGDITVSSQIVTGAMSGDATLSLQAARHISITGDAGIDATQNGNTAKLNVQLLADIDDSGDGINIVTADGIKTNGGDLTFGDGSTANIGGTNVLVGGDVYISGSTAQTIDTDGGDVTINGETIVANSSASGVTFDSGGGSILFGGVINSGNSYTLQSSNLTWNNAFAAASSGTGDQLGDTYLATVTSRLENALAGIAANYTPSWLGGRRVVGIGTDSSWRWVTGPEGLQDGGNGLVFANQNAGGGATTVDGSYNNWNGSEPNNWNGSGSGSLNQDLESGLQFTGTAGLWNDLPRSSPVLPYVTETNLAPSSLTVNAGAGTVTFNGGVGGGKALASLDITSAATTVNGNALVTTGAQNYSSGLDVTSTFGLEIAGTTLTTGGALDFTVADNLTLGASLDTQGNVSLSGDQLVLSGNQSISAGSNDITLTADDVTSGVIMLNTTGHLTFAPKSNAWTSANIGGQLDYTGTIAGTTFTGSSDVDWLTINNYSTLGGLTLGKDGNTSSIYNYQPIDINGPVSLIGNNVTLDANIDTSSVSGGDVLLKATGGILLPADRLITTDGGSVTFDGTLNSSGGTRNLAVNAGTGATNLNGAVGGSSALGTITITGAANANANITTTGEQSYGGLLTIGTGTPILSAGTLTTDDITAGSNDFVLRADTFAIGGDVTGTGNATLNSQTVGADLGVGATTSTVNINNSTLNAFQDGFASITVGETNSGSLTVAGLTTLTDDLTLRAGSGKGLFVSGDINWTSNNALTLAAGDDVWINSNIDISGATASLNLLYGGTDGTTTPDSGDNYYIDVSQRKRIDFDATTANLKIGNEDFTLIESASDLIGMNASGRYALIGDLDLSGTTYTDAVYDATFTGKLDGLGHEIDGMTITASDGDNYGLFDQLSGASIRHLGVTGIDILGQSTSNAAANDLRIGGIVGNVSGSGTTLLDGLWSTGVIATKQGSQQDVFYAGGIAGSHDSGTLQILRSFSTVNVSSQGSHSGKMALGGLLGDSGNLHGTSSIGGSATHLKIDRSYANGSIVEGTYDGYYGSGGLVGVVFGTSATLTDSFSQSNVVGGVSSGGIAGFSSGATTKTYQRLYTTLDRFGNGTAPSQSYKSDTIDAATNNGTQLPSGWLSDIWTAGDLPTLKALGVPASLLYVKVTGGTGVFGDLAAPTYQIVDADGNAVNLGSGDYVGLDGVTGTGRYTLGQFTNAGTYNSVSYLSGLGLTGDDANLFALNPFTTAGSYTITPRSITAVLAATGVDKVYDGTAGAGSGYSPTWSFTNIVSGDSATLNIGSSFFNDADVLDANLFTINGLSLAGLTSSNGSLISDYVLANSTASVAANITAKPIVINGLFANDKIYDGNTTASIDTSGVNYSGLVSGDSVSLTGLGGTFVDKNVGTNKTVNLTGSFTGTDASNYSATLPTTVTGNITPKAITTSGITSSNRVYDGTTAAIVDTSGISFDGMVAGDTLTVSGTVGAYADKNVETGKTVTLSGSTYGGADAGNYTITGQATTTSNITPKSITVSGLTASDRTYDGTTAATVDHTGVNFSGLLSGDSLNASGTSGTFSDKNVANGKSVTLSGTSYGGSDVGNYAITDQTSTTADITQKAITVSGITANNKVYDGTTTATVDLSGLSLNGIVSGDDLTLTGTAGAFSNKKVANGKTVTLSGTSFGGTDVGNYSITDQASTTANITPKAITVFGLAANDRVYDGTTAATIDHSGASFNGIVTGDDLTATGTAGTFADKNVGSSKSVALSGTTYGGSDVGNYSFTDQASSTADITPKSITVSGLVANDRIYDGTTATTVDHSGVTFSGMVSGDILNASGTTGAFVDKNVGNTKSVTLSGTNYGGADSGNYTFTNQTSSTANITAKSISVGGLTANDRVYDGTTLATVDHSGVAFTGIIAGDNLTATGTSGTFADRNAGTSKSVALSGTTYGGTDVGNYAFTDQMTTTADITPKTITTSGLTADNRVYDGTTSVTVDHTGVTFNGIVIGDSLTASGTIGTLADKHVGTSKSVALSGTTYGGADVGNYTFADQTSSTADITAKSIVVSGLVANDRIYDGTTDATVDHSGVTFNGIVGGDILSASNTRGSFGDKHVATNKSVTLSGTTYGGADAGNYLLTDQTSATADITQKSITISGITAADKVYDATTSAVVDRSSIVFGGIVAGDVLTAANTTGNFSDRHAADGKTVTLSGTTYGGVDLGNYSITDQASTTANISQKALSLDGFDAANKVYDGNTTAAIVNAGSLTGVISGDTVSVANSGATFTDKNVGASKTVTLSGITISSTDAANYSIASTVTDTADITQKAITLDGFDAASKIYDGNVTAGINDAGSLTGVVTGDAVNVANSGATFADKNVGAGKTVTLSGITISGTDAANYSIASTVTDTADITQKAITLDGFDVASKIYDGNVAAGINDAGSLTGVVTGDTVNVANSGATFADKNVGASKTVTLSGITISGTDAANYSIASTVTDTAGITQKAITLDGFDAASKIYDGNVTAGINDAGSLTGVVTGDAVSVANSGATFADKNVGASKTVTLSGITISGTDADNYSIASTVTDTADITQKAITLDGFEAASKIYDGNARAGVSNSGSLTGVVTGDIVTFDDRGAKFADRHAANGKTVTLNGIMLFGADAANYSIGATVTDTADITPKVVTINLPSASKVYDGNVQSPATTDQLQSFTRALGVSGDSIDAVELTFDTKNVGSQKTLSASNIRILDGNSGRNYLLTVSPNHDSVITRLNSVAWIGGVTGDWNDPANWAGGAVPDLANVANVIIPAGTTPLFGASVNGPVDLDSLSGGSLQIEGNTLNVAGPVVVDGFTQTGGTVTADSLAAAQLSQSNGSLDIQTNLTVSNSFNQPVVGTPAGSNTGEIKVGDRATITHRTGDLTVANLSAGDIQVTNTSGNIALGVIQTQRSLTVSAATDVQQTSEGHLQVGGNTDIIAGGNATLTQTQNDLSGPLSVSAKNVAITNSAQQTQLERIRNTGTLKVVSTGGSIQQTATSEIDSQGAATLGATGEIKVGGDRNVFKSTVNLAGTNVSVRQARGDLQLGKVVSDSSFRAAAPQGSVVQDSTGSLAVNGDTVIEARREVNLSNVSNRFGGTVSVDSPIVSVEAQAGVALQPTGRSMLNGIGNQSAARATNDTFVRPAEGTADASIKTDDQTGGQTSWYQEFTSFVAGLFGSNASGAASPESESGAVAGLQFQQDDGETFLRRGSKNQN